MKSFRIIVVAVCTLLLHDLSRAQKPEGKPGKLSSKAAGQMINKLDRDGDGIVMPGDIPPEARAAVSRIVEKAGLDADKPIPVAKLQKFLTKKKGRRNNEDDAKSAPSENQGGFNFGGADQGVPAAGFQTSKAQAEDDDVEDRVDADVAQYVDKLLNRFDKNANGQLDDNEWYAIARTGDPRLSDTNGDSRLSRAELSARISKRWGRKPTTAPLLIVQSTTSSSSAAKGTNKKSTANRAKIRRAAQSLLNQYDKNQNGVLEKEEWKRMRSTHAKADRDGNGTITLDELTDRLEEYTQEKDAKKKVASGAKRKRSYYRRNKDWSDDRKSYRFLTATERLPKGLPDWFARNDRDADGQVAMHEYATTWTNGKIEEFAKYDRNGDGIITAAECLATDDS